MYYYFRKFIYLTRKNISKEVFFLGLEFVNTIEKIVERPINNKLEYYKNVVLLTYKKSTWSLFLSIFLFLSFFF